jgi:hypothetical protein
MSDTGHPPATPEPPPIPPAPAAPRAQRNGCLTAFLVLAGLILLLPGVCTFLFFGNSSTPSPILVVALLVAFGGVALILFALLRER